MRMKKIGVIGSRGYRDYDTLRSTMDSTVRKHGEIHIISGGAGGADRLAEEYARDRQMTITIMYAKWDILGNRAGYARNSKLVDECDEIYAFWDGQSKGTNHAIELAKKRRVPVVVVAAE